MATIRDAAFVYVEVVNEFHGRACHRRAVELQLSIGGKQRDRLEKGVGHYTRRKRSQDIGEGVMGTSAMRRADTEKAKKDTGVVSYDAENGQEDVLTEHDVAPCFRDQRRREEERRCIREAMMFD